jgi:TatD DNase family protein
MQHAPQWIDVHCHLNFLDVSPEQAVEQARAAGVTRLVTIGTCPDDHGEVLRLVDTFPETVYGTLGVHPHEAQLFNDEVERFIRTHAIHPKIVAVGEIGLDYYYDNSPRDVQREAFRRQLQMALDLNMPIEIHTRDAEADTIEILQEFNGRIRGLVHCFTGTQWLADEALKLGLNISMSGVVTFKKAEELRRVCESIPLERLHVETDAPFLAPVPKRGAKNLPEYVVHTAELVASLKGVTLTELAAQTRVNALEIFPKLQWR